MEMRSFCVLLLLCGCVEPSDTEMPDRSSVGQFDKVKPMCTVIDNRSLVENDPAIINDARFSLARVFERIRATTPSEYTVPTAREMFSQLFAAYGRGADADVRGYGLKQRNAEAQLGTYDPFTPEGLHFKPVAVFNRFDLSNAKADTCGESRIVYWMERAPVTGRSSVIIELHTPPVYDDHGKATCTPIADFWASLSTEPSPDARAAMLDNYYFNGLPGMPYAPASARGAGWDGFGQLRANNFIGNVQWNLREAKWQGSCNGPNCSAGFAIADTKNSPSEKLFAKTHGNAAAFEHWFLSKAVPKLAKADDVNELTLGNGFEFNELESISQPFADDPSSVLYKQAASAQFKADISAKLAEDGWNLTADNILDRATAMTCGGCHRVSRNADLGGGLVFPAPSGFTHVTETGALSPALTNQFLPARLDLLQSYLCGKNFDPGDGDTISGHAIHEPN
jgi:hypothetical protein